MDKSVLLVAFTILAAGCLQTEDRIETTTTLHYPAQTATLKAPETTVREMTANSTTFKTTMSTTIAKPTTTTSVPQPQVHEIDVTAKRFSFNPSTIKVKQGDKLILRITSADTTHGFAIDEYAIDVTLSRGRKG